MARYARVYPKDSQPVQKIVINFESFEDVKLFAELIGQNLTKKPILFGFHIRKNKI